MKNQAEPIGIIAAFASIRKHFDDAIRAVPMPTKAAPLRKNWSVYVTTPYHEIGGLPFKGIELIVDCSYEENRSLLTMEAPNEGFLVDPTGGLEAGEAVELTIEEKEEAVAQALREMCPGSVEED